MRGRTRVRVCVRAGVRACVRTCVRAPVRALGVKCSNYVLNTVTMSEVLATHYIMLIRARELAAESRQSAREMRRGWTVVSQEGVLS
jgi:hypothetical protein